VVLLGAVVLAGLAPAPASAINAADEAATHAFLQAEYVHEAALVDDRAAEAASVGAFVSQVGGECAGVLKGAPSEEDEGAGPTTPPTPRQRGEQQRGRDQRTAIEEELQQAFLGALSRPDLPALRAFAAQTANLTWSDPRVAATIKTEFSSSLRAIEGAPADVCADLHAWAASGFRAVSPATRAFVQSRHSTESELESEPDLGRLLKPTEGRAELALVKRIERFGRRFARVTLRPYAQVQRLEHTLGRPESAFERSEHAPVVARGMTSTGKHWTLRVRDQEQHLGPVCRRALTLQVEEQTKRHGVVVNSGTSETPVCLGKGEMQGSPSGQGGCQELTIDAAVPASVRTVELRLRDGRTITSRVVRVPRRYGGPAGVYIESVRGHRARPVSLTELDDAGRVVAVRRFGREFGCPEHRPEVHPPKIVTLVRGTTADGEPFAITGTLVHFGRHYEFSVDESGPPSSGITAVESGSFGGEVAQRTPKAFEWFLANQCAPRAHAIVYGTLTPPGANVLARTPSGLVPLTLVPIAADLHAPGPLAYGVFTEVPSELIVKRSDGSTLYAESLVGKAAEEAEYCAGYAEP